MKIESDVTKAKGNFRLIIMSCYAKTDPDGEAEAMLEEVVAAADEGKWAKAWEYLATAHELDPYAVDAGSVKKVRHLSRFIRLGGVEVI